MYTAGNVSNGASDDIASEISNCDIKILKKNVLLYACETLNCIKRLWEFFLKKIMI
jgi:hypothetical protein